MQQGLSRLHEPDVVDEMLQLNGASERGPQVPVLQVVQVIHLVGAGNFIDELAAILARLRVRERVVVEVGLARIHKVNVLGEGARKLALARAEVALDREDQTVLAELLERRVEDLPEQAVALLGVVERLLVPLAYLLDGELTPRVDWKARRRRLARTQSARQLRSTPGYFA